MSQYSNKLLFIFRFNFLSVLFFLIAGNLFAQEKITVSGIVTDPDSKSPLANVSVIQKGSVNGTVTDQNGAYTITVSPGSTLVFTYLNGTPQEVQVAVPGQVNVTVSARQKSLDEVVVIGYGSRKRKDLTGAVSTVNSKDIEKSTSMTPELALQGKAAGVFIESGGGSPGARPTVRIRGVNTFGYSEPLYVIDGVPMYEGGAGVTSGAIGDIRSSINIFSLINPADIESMTVLKDASAAAIYGVRASNGVILITTKQGKAGKSRVEVNASYGYQNIPKTINTLNTQQYFDLVRESYNNFPDANTSFEQKFGPLYDPASPGYAGNGPTYNWQEQLKNKNAALQDYNVKVSGGNAGTTYYFSGGYSKTESPLKANYLERYSIAMNVDSRVSKFLQAGVTLRLVQQNSYDNTQTDMSTMMSTIPFQPFFSQTDKTGFAPAVSANFVANPAYDPNLLNPGAPFVFDGDPTLLWGTQTRSNIFAFQNLNSTRYDLFTTIGSGYVQIEPLAGLKLKGTLGGQYYNNLRKSFNSFDAWRFSQTPGNPFDRQDGNAKGSYGERLGRTYNLNKELTLNYTRSFGDHSIDVLLSASDQYSRWSWNDISGNVNFSDPQYWGVQNQPPYTGGYAGILQEDALLGYLGRISYKFSDKYYLDATLRRDGSSRLAPGHKWDNFPSFAAAWRISKEKFFPATTFINDLKLRGGWGRLGNFQSAGYYEFLSTISLTPDYSLGSGNGNNNGSQVQGAVLPNFANTTLTWEKVKTTSVGLDAVLFNNHLNFTAEYYSKTTFDIIQSVALPPNTGIQQPADLNVASVSNKGIELQLGYNTKIGDVNFNASANITTVKNRVTALNGGTAFGGNGGRVELGYPLFYLWGYKVGGIFQDQAEIDAWKQTHSKGDANIGANEYQPGDMYFQDLNGAPRNKDEIYSPAPDSAVNDYDRVYLGKTIPGYYYGFNVGAEYKGFDISVFFQGVGDVQKYNYVRSGLEGMSGPANQWATVLNRWTPANHSSSMPRAVYADPYGAQRFSDRFVENASYLRLKNLQIGYNVPRNIIGKINFLQNFRVYLSGINLFTITKYTGLDPENDLIPPTRQFLVGVNAAF